MFELFAKLRELIPAGLSPWGGKLRRAGRERRLRLQETLPLGEQRFLAIVEFHGRDLLIGGTAHSITLLEAVERGCPAPPAQGQLAPEYERQSEEPACGKPW